MLGSRAIYHDGWRAVCPWPGPSFAEAGMPFGQPISADTLSELDATAWELYHVDEDFAKQVGLPGRILHGLWTMAQVARAQTEAAGGPEKLARLEVQFRGMGVPEQEITVTSKVVDAQDGHVVVEAEAEQGGKRIVRNGRAELRTQ